jgi:hypothetical protein
MLWYIIFLGIYLLVISVPGDVAPDASGSRKLQDTGFYFDDDEAYTSGILNAVAVVYTEGKYIESIDALAGLRTWEASANAMSRGVGFSLNTQSGPKWYRVNLRSAFSSGSLQDHVDELRTLALRHSTHVIFGLHEGLAAQEALIAA